jgi:GT2 family glycosyltransferase
VSAAPATDALPRTSAVMPVFDGRHYLERSLPPLLARVGRDLCEVIVVDDGSTDGSGELAAASGARVLRTAGRVGPGAARNQAAREARGDALLFVDADVVIHEDTVERARRALAQPGVVAVFGSYDDAPPDPAFASQYMNLRHHFVHQQGAGEATTFWAGCGAVRRDAFLEAGGYDGQRYERPSIEDIELGYRLRAHGGRILNEPAMLATHLKQWTLRSVVETDLRCRAIPWSRLLLEHPSAEADLNAGAGEQVRAGLAGLLLLSLPTALLGWAPAWLPALLFAAALVANRRIFALFRRRRGLPFALGALLFHQLYYVYSASAFVGCWLESRLGLRRAEAVR